MIDLIRIAKEIVDLHILHHSRMESLSAYRAAILETFRELREVSEDGGEK